MAEFKTTDPRDKIFSVYWLLKDKMVNFPEPDYSKTAAMVYVGATKSIIETLNSVNVLGCIYPSERRLDGLPFWVYDWTQPYTDHIISKPSELTPDINHSGIWDRAPTFEAEGKRIIIFGIEYDHCHLATIPPQLENADDSFNTFSKSIDFLHEWLYFCARHSNNKSITQAHDAISLLISRDESTLESARTNLLELLSLVLTSVRIDDADTSTANTIHRESAAKERIDHFYQENFRFAKLKADYLRQLIQLYHPFVTPSGRIGVAKGVAIRKDDIVVLFCRSSIPMIIRSCSEGYELVGMVLVEDLVDDEQAWLFDEGKLQEFILV
jgi:hypothetical protein